MSSGGKLQLAFKGPQDAYLSGRPQMTYFKAIYKRYTNYAKECIWIPFDGNPKQGGKSTAILERQGDLVQEAFITADIAVVATDLTGSIDATISNNLAYAAERIIESVDLYIGQQLIDKHYQRWWRIFSELNHDDAKKAQYSKMTTPDSVGTNKIYLPLNFFFNRNPGLALPLISLGNQQVRIVCNWNNDEGVWTGVTSTPQVVDSSIKFWANYVFLDQEERNVMTERDQSYLIDQVQFSGSETITATSPAGTVQRIPLNFKHPVKELVWCFPNDTQSQKQYNFTKKSVNVNEVITNGQSEPHLSGGTVRLFNGEIMSETADGPLSSMYIEINKSKVAEEQGGKYYNSVQSQQHHTGCPIPGLYSYSFALRPESIKPTGSCNFSRIQDAACFVRTKNATNTLMELYATNFNVLDIKKGFASLAFSS